MHSSDGTERASMHLSLGAVIQLVLETRRAHHLALARARKFLDETRAHQYAPIVDAPSPDVAS